MDRFLVELTEYPGLYRPTDFSTAVYSWPELTKRLTHFVETEDKFSVPGFGGHVLRGPKRAREHVLRVTFLGFDVDAAQSFADIRASMDLFKAELVALHAYSSHSHTPEKPALRFIVPISRPLDPEEYASVRKHVIEKFRIPCKVEQSTDVSRFWFYPSRRPGAPTFVETLVGTPLNIADIPITRDPPDFRRGLGSKPWSPPPEPQRPINLEPLRRKIRERAERQAARNNPIGEITLRIIDGRQAAESGRNEATFRACGSMIYAADNDTPVSAFMAIVMPSLRAMQAAGSSLTERKVERFFLTAMEKRACNTRTLDALDEFRREILARKAARDVEIGRPPNPVRE